MAKKTMRTEATLTDYPFRNINKFINKIDFLKNLYSSKKVYLIILVIGLLILVIFKKNWFIAAFVNGTPITNLELQTKLNQQFRTQTLNQMINEKIILEEARKNSAIPTEAEITSKISELEANVGGKDVLETLLSQQGQTRVSLRDQLRTPLSISKLYDRQATVSAEEVSKFLSENRSLLRATDSAQQEKEAYDTIKNQKLSQIFNQKFQELRTKAKITIF